MVDSWYYIRDKRKVGPVAFGELGKLASSGQLHGTDMVLQQGSDKWVLANMVGLKFAPDITPTAATSAPGINSTPEGTSASQPLQRKWNRWIIGSASGLIAILGVSFLIAGRLERDPAGKIPNATQETPKSEDLAQLPSVSPPVAQKAPALDEPPFREKEPAKKEASATNKDKSVVVAEGFGSTGDAALKDAFRKAVRQVVGAVVDAETLVKDDQIISDKVLTYSDGFVKTYEEISTLQDMGIFRTKINATVERRSLIAKLRAANVAVKNVDGKGLFAEVVTDLEAAKNAKELMEKALEDFPLNVLEAEVLGKPEIVERSPNGVKLTIHVQFKANGKGYETFIARFRNTLKALARERGEFSIQAQKRKKVVIGNGGELPLDALYVEYNAKNYMPPMAPRKIGDRFIAQAPDLLAWAPAGRFPRDDYFAKFDHRYLIAKKRGHIVVACGTPTSTNAEQTQWEYFAVDESIQPTLVSRCMRIPKLKVSLLAESGKVIRVVSKNGFVLPEMRSRPRRADDPVYFVSPIFPGCGRVKVWLSEKDYLDPRLRKGSLDKEVLFLIAPFFIESEQSRDSTLDFYCPIIETTVVFTLSLDEVKATKNVKCELTDQ